MKPEQLIREIIDHQGEIIGINLAKQLATKYSGVSLSNGDLTMPEKPVKDVVNDLINGYEKLFGRSSVEVCLDVIKMHPSSDTDAIIPDLYANKVRNRN